MTTHREHRRRLMMVWSRKDFDDAVDQAVALTKDQQANDSVLGPVQLGDYHQREHFAPPPPDSGQERRLMTVWGELNRPVDREPCPVIDLFTRQRVR